MPRLRYPRLDVIKKLCAERSWDGIPELAEGAGITIGAATNIFTGNGVYRCIVKQVAQTFGRSLGYLLPPDDPESDEYLPPHQAESEGPSGLHPAPNTPPALRAVRLTFNFEKFSLAIDVNIDDVTDSKLAILLNTTLRSVGLNPDLEPSSIRYASVHVTFDVSEEEALKVFDNYVDWIEVPGAQPSSEGQPPGFSLLLTPFHTVTTSMEDVERRLTDYRRSCAENNALIQPTESTPVQLGIGSQPPYARRDFLFDSLTFADVPNSSLLHRGLSAIQFISELPFNRKYPSIRCRHAPTGEWILEPAPPHVPSEPLVGAPA